MLEGGSGNDVLIYDAAALPSTAARERTGCY